MSSIGWSFSVNFNSFHLGNVLFNRLGCHTNLFRHLRDGHFGISTNYFPDYYPGFTLVFPWFSVFSVPFPGELVD